MSDENNKWWEAPVLDILSKLTVLATVAAVSWVGGMIWDHENRLSKIEVTRYQMKDAMEDRRLSIVQQDRLIEKIDALRNVLDERLRIIEQKVAALK